MASCQNSSPTDAELEDAILRVCSETKHGLFCSDIIDKIQTLTPPKLVFLANKLALEGKLAGIKVDNRIAYRTKYKPKATATPNLPSRPALTDENELSICKAVEESGSKGLTPQNLKPIVNLTVPTIKKILGILEKKGYVKSYLPVYSNEKSSTIKVYVSAAFVPDASVTGGGFYEDSEIQEDYVKELGAEIFAFLCQKFQTEAPPIEDLFERHKHGLASSQEIFKHVSSKVASKRGLNMEEFEKALAAMVNEGTITLHNVKKDKILVNKMYQAAFEIEKTVKIGAKNVPCSYCKIFEDCCLDGVVNPIQCDYFNKWLGL